jgi:hypothetical protein
MTGKPPNHLRSVVLRTDPMDALLEGPSARVPSSSEGRPTWYLERCLAAYAAIFRSTAEGRATSPWRCATTTATAPLGRRPPHVGREIRPPRLDLVPREGASTRASTSGSKRVKVFDIARGRSAAACQSCKPTMMISIPMKRHEVELGYRAPSPMFVLRMR